MLFSGSTSAMNASIPCVAARCASCSSSRVPMPLPWNSSATANAASADCGIAEADVVPDADDALLGAIAHDPDQRAALGPVGLDEAPHEAVACDGEAVEAEEAAADGEVGEERHHPGHVRFGRGSQAQRGAVAQDDVDGRLGRLGEIGHAPSVTDGAPFRIRALRGWRRGKPQPPERQASGRTTE